MVTRQTLQCHLLCTRAICAASHLTHYRLQGLGAEGLVFDQLQAQLAADSAYTVFQIAAHRAPNRTTAQVELAGRGARCEWH